MKYGPERSSTYSFAIARCNPIIKAGLHVAKSITWLECEHAWKITRKEVLAFIVDPNAPWPPDQKEDYRLVLERKKPNILQEVERNEANLELFKKELGKYFRKQFSDVPS